LVIGAAFSSLGQEASSCASAYAVEQDDIIAPMIRNAGSTLVKGLPPRDFLANYMYRTNSPTGGRDGNTHMGDLRYGIIAPISMLGASIALCSGYVLAARMKGQKRVALTWIGEGSTSTGEFHEDVNFAAVMKAPLVVIIENNQYAYSTPTSPVPGGALQRQGRRLRHQARGNDRRQRRQRSLRRPRATPWIGPGRAKARRCLKC
jgi:TPP-dependent pyruvate/acetoin dehydrogenase alpha subunit